MNNLELRKQAALLEATLREMLRIADAAEQCPICVPFDAALEGEHARQWARIVARARGLLAPRR